MANILAFRTALATLFVESMSESTNTFVQEDLRDWRVCAFCGRAPEKKTKEHIIPMWLQHFAGNVEVPAMFVVPGAVHDRKWASCTLPACRRCNEAFGRLEQLMKRTFERIRSGSITAADMKLMLLWMDKIRVGWWLLSLTLGKKSHGITPNFQIGPRLGLADHLVRIFRYDTDAEGIALVGSDTDAFFMMPSVVGLVVRDIVILSLSASGFLQERMGLVVPEEVVRPDGEEIVWSFGRPGGIYNPRWSDSLFRFNQARFFEFKYHTGHHFDHKPNVVYTDKNGRLEELEGCTSWGIPVIGGLDSRTKLKFMIEVAELQRVLLNTFGRLKLDASGKQQVKRAQRQLDARLDLYAKTYDLLSPLPINRRTFVTWI